MKIIFKNNHWKNWIFKKRIYLQILFYSFDQLVLIVSSPHLPLPNLSHIMQLVTLLCTWTYRLNIYTGRTQYMWSPCSIYEPTGWTYTQVEHNTCGHPALYMNLQVKHIHRKNTIHAVTLLYTWTYRLDVFPGRIQYMRSTCSLPEPTGWTYTQVE